MANRLASLGLRVGHVTDSEAKTGCTVIRFPPQGARCSVDVRGAGPGTRETDLLQPVNLIESVHAVLLSGGSAFGLAAASGVARQLEAEGIGLGVLPGVRVPIVPAAVLFDLAVGDAKRRPDESWGQQACKDASEDAPLSGPIGAGTGASVGKLLGYHRASPSGLGFASRELDGGHQLAALFAVNAVGEVQDADGTILAGIRGEKPGEFVPAAQVLSQSLQPIISNTTIGLVVTDLPLTKTQLKRLAEVAHDGLARAVFPAHTMFDGDTIFAASVAPTAEGIPAQSLSMLGAMATDLVSEAIRDAVRGRVCSDL